MIIFSVSLSLTFSSSSSFSVSAVGSSSEEEASLVLWWVNTNSLGGFVRMRFLGGFVRVRMWRAGRPESLMDARDGREKERSHQWTRENGLSHSLLKRGELCREISKLLLSI